MTLDVLRAYQKATIPLDEALKTLGLGRTAGREAARAGTLGVPVLRLGVKRLVVPTVALQRLLGLEPEPLR